MVTCEVLIVLITLVIACFVNQSLIQIKMKISVISSKVLSKVKSQLSYLPLNLKRILEDN